MPRDKQGKQHLNPQRARAADRAAAAKPKPVSSDPGMTHDTASSIPEHLSQIHAAHGGKHMHVTHDGMSYQTQHVGEDGQVQGPHDHENLKALQDHMNRFFHEEAGEMPDEDGY